jgi:hypothetical protein
MVKPPVPRTIWAEHQVEDFLALPLISEFVFRSPQMIDASQKEVVDFLIACGGSALLVSQKCQEDPTRRDVGKTGSWARKAAVKGAAQLRGALKPRSNDPSIWCDHARRGRVEFPAGLPAIGHAVVTLEVYEAVDLSANAADLPVQAHGVPVSYLSLNDFLNLAIELRTIPDLLDYLDARAVLPEAERLMVGNERALFEVYLLNDGSFPSDLTRQGAADQAAARAPEVGRAVRAKTQADQHSLLIEHVADQLATRNPRYAEGISASTLARFEPDDARSGYLDMQTVLASLHLGARIALGRAFAEVVTKVETDGSGFRFMAAHLDPHPDDVFVFAASRGNNREELLQRIQALSAAALAHYDRTRCLVIADRDGEGYEVLLERSRASASAEQRELGARLFGGLRMSDRPISQLRPQSSL